MKDKHITEDEFDEFLQANDIGPGTIGYGYVMAYAQKKYQEGELNGKIVSLNTLKIWLKINHPDSKDAIDGTERMLERLNQRLESQLERKEQ